jgi:glycosyltransferase involved in cell wall biosynthesis
VFAQTAVFVLMPNCQEGLGGVVLEAMAMKVPVVAFDSGGIGECFSNNTSGFLVPQGDTQAAADAVILLIQNPEVRNTLGTHARDELLSRFTYEKHFSGIEAVYTSLLR